MKLVLDPGDVVKIDHLGRLFFAVVEEVEGQELKIAPLDRNTTWRTATAREVIGIWRASKATQQRERQRTRAAATPAVDERQARLFA